MPAQNFAETRHRPRAKSAPQPSLSRAPDWVWESVAYLPAAAAAPALALGIAGLAGRGPRLLSERRWLSALTALGGAALLVRWQLERLITEEPEYEVERSLNGLEIRHYGPRVIAETLVENQPDWDVARSEGFRRLASYIFGGNQREQGIAMTGPVSVGTGAKKSERIAITAPVGTRRAAAGYVVSFTMPKQYELESLPAPSDERVLLRQVPGERVAVLRFSGRYRSELIHDKQAELVRRARAAGLETVGEPLFAGYDAPSTLPFLRRVEVWVPIAAP
jgi:hypothetical protein